MYLYTHGGRGGHYPKPFNTFQLSTKAEVPSFGLSPCIFKNKYKREFHFDIMGF